MSILDTISVLALILSPAIVAVACLRYGRCQIIIVQRKEDPPEAGRAFRAGDIITTEVEYAALPPGSIVAGDHHNPAVRRESGDWKNTSSRQQSPRQMSANPRRVLRVGWEA